MKKPTDLSAGDAIFIPRYYAASGSVWISPTSHLPVRFEIRDAEDRLYERYVYTNVRSNVGLTDLDFDVANPDYRF